MKEYCCSESLIECDICTYANIKFIALPCQHKCCANCFEKINKCHMCRKRLNKCNPMKTKINILFRSDELKLQGERCELKRDRSASVPLYFDTINPKVDFILLNKTYDIMQEVINIYGYENFSALEFNNEIICDIDTKLSITDCYGIVREDIDNIIMLDRNSVILSCINKIWDENKKCNCDEREIEKIQDYIKFALLNFRFDELEREYE